MSRRLLIIDDINRDLKVQRCSGETDGRYHARIIYSALSMWVRHSILDKDILAPSKKEVGVSKIHIINRCKPFLENMLELFPECKEWIFPDKEDQNPITIVRDRLNNINELIDVGYQTNVGLPDYRELIINPGVNIVRGLSQSGYSYMSGIAQLKVSDNLSNINFSNLLKAHGLPSNTALEILESNLKRITWVQQSIVSEQILDKYSSQPFSYTWHEDTELKNGDISLYRNDFYDFGFIKFEEGKSYLSQINKYLIDKKEVRRFMYGLKKEVNNPVKAYYIRHSSVHLVELILYNKLPSIEERLLLLLGWPKNNISDSRILLFDDSVWTFVTVILKQLHIKLEEMI